MLNGASFSLSLMNGQLLFQALLFGATALAAMAMLVGYRTRLVTAVVWVAMLSILWRNTLVSSGGDVLLILLLFWSLFLPLGAYWSVDRALKTERAPLSMRFLSAATVALFMQIAFVYWFGVVMKSGSQWRTDGTALYYALNLERITTSIGAYLAQFPTLLEVLTYATLALELIGPLLLFCPFLTGPVRTAAVGAFMSFHLGIWLTMSLGMINWASGLCMVCFLPGWFWDEALPKLRTAFPRQSDAMHRLRHLVASSVQAYWAPLWQRFSPTIGLGQPVPVGLMARGGDARPSTQTGSKHATPTTEEIQLGGTRSTANFAAGREIRRAPTTGPRPAMLRSWSATNLIVLFFLLYVLCWNLMTVSALTMPKWATSLGPLLGLQQTWSMFSPYPPTNDGWYVIPGSLRDGQQVDLRPIISGDFEPHELSWEKPRHVLRTYENEHWRKYMVNLLDPRYTNQRGYFAYYICREWNAHHTGPDKLISLDLAYMQETTLANYRQATPQKVALWENQSCI